MTPSKFVQIETSGANGAPPISAMKAAIKRLEDVAYARGFDAALSRLEMLSAVDPDSVTKAQLITKLKREVLASRAEWHRNQFGH